jgi:vanillate/4-hydroxybenzoate decarboxylase subunit D
MTCPRCDSNDACQVFEAHDGSWRIYQCPRCNFNWRSTEPDEVRDGRLYDPRFKLTEKRFQEMVAKPQVPLLREGT